MVCVTFLFLKRVLCENNKTKTRQNWGNQVPCCQCKFMN
uniref:Uncharacterized protein n=1 Tax=Anguilla anguilla TaxID=7936 RepID=A0A0E9U797_ANGAN